MTATSVRVNCPVKAVGVRLRNSAGSAEDCSGYETDDCAEGAEKRYRRHRGFNTAVMPIVREQADSEIADDCDSE